MQFSSHLSYTISKDKPSTNLIFSPVSIRTCLALLYMGARGTVAEQLRWGLCLRSKKKELAAEQFRLLLDNVKKCDAEFKIVNRIYLGDKLRAGLQFNELACKYFESSAESVKFSNTAKAAEIINAWVEEQTEQKIKNIVKADALNADTKMILINAIYFKAKWKKTFDSTDTRRYLFNVNRELKVPVQMMFQEDDFYYGDITGLNACAIELPYAGSGDLSMLILVPRRMEGISYLESKLQYIDLTRLSEKLQRGRVKLGLPKFKIEFDISLKPVLEELGMERMFTDQANFNGLLTMNYPLKVSEVKHKAFIEVSESGTEAAAATYAKIVPRSAPQKGCNFIIDQPFFFVIKDAKNIYFAGHVTNFL